MAMSRAPQTIHRKHRKTVLNLSADNGVEQSRKLRAAAKTTVPKE